MSPCNGAPISPEATATDNSGDSHSSNRGIEGNGNHRCVSQCPSLRHSIQANNCACTCVQRVCCFPLRLSTKTSPKQQHSTKSQGFRGRPWKRLQQARSWTLEDVFTHRYKAKSERRRGRKEEARKPYLVTKVVHAWEKQKQLRHVSAWKPCMSLFGHACANVCASMCFCMYLRSSLALRLSLLCPPPLLTSHARQKCYGSSLLKCFIIFAYVSSGVGFETGRPSVPNSVCIFSVVWCHFIYCDIFSFVEFICISFHFLFPNRVMFLTGRCSLRVNGVPSSKINITCGHWPVPKCLPFQDVVVICVQIVVVSLHSFPNAASYAQKRRGRRRQHHPSKESSTAPKEVGRKAAPPKKGEKAAPPRRKMRDRDLTLPHFSLLYTLLYFTVH